MNPESPVQETIRVQEDSGKHERDGSQYTSSVRRACLECRRKKTKCDMRQPTCGLCQRTGGSCTFPTKRKTPEFKRPCNRQTKRQLINSRRLRHLVDLLESNFNDSEDSDDSPTQSSGGRQSDSQTSDTHTDTLAYRESSLSGLDRQPSDSHSICSIDTAVCIVDNRDDPDLCSPSRQSLQTQHSWLTIPEQVAIELIHLFFDKVQPWLPLLHRPKFLAYYVSRTTLTFLDPTGWDDEDMLMLYGIFALAACHSSNTYFRDVPAPDRGDRFADKATHYYGILRDRERHPNFKYLQGSVLLAVYLYASGPCHRAWMLTGVCVRMAYDLDLCNMDEKDHKWQDTAEWTDLEERRRLFWVVWELDTFGSTLIRRPSAINRQRMAVLLPVSDASWFAQQPVESALPGVRPAEAWKSLLGSPNQDERAWFLLANYLMAVAFDIASSGRICESEQSEIMSALACFNLALPQHFSLETHAVLFDSENLIKHNWVIGIHLMLISARTCVSALAGTQRASPLIWEREFSRVIYHWNPRAIILSHPFFACILLTPRVIFAAEALQPLNAPNHNIEMTKLLLAQYGLVWKLGFVLIDLAGLLNRRDTLSDKEMELAKRFAIFFPCQSKGQRNESLSQSLPTVDTGDTSSGNDGSMGTSFSKASLELMESSEQPEIAGFQIMALNELDPIILDEAMPFQPEIHDEQASGSKFDHLYDDKQNFNYLQL